MQATLMLAEEHRLLGIVLHCLELLLVEAKRTDRLDGEEAARILDLLERFADGCHQEKEEAGLLPLLLRRVEAGDRGLVLSLLAEHANERRLLADLRGHLEGAAYGEPTCLDVFVLAAYRYVGLQRKHAAWEDEVLLPLAERLLSEDEDEELLDVFRRVEDRFFPGTTGRPQRLVRELFLDLGLVEEARELAPRTPGLEPRSGRRGARKPAPVVCSRSGAGFPSRR